MHLGLARALLGEDALGPHAGAHGDALLELLTHAREDAVGALRAHVADGRCDQREPVQQCLAGDLVDLLAAAVDFVGGPVLDPDAVHVGDELGEAVAGHEAVEPPADVGRQGQLAVAEGPGSAPAAGDVAGVAAGADTRLARRAGAAADVGPALDEQHRGAVAPYQLERGEDAGGAAAYHDDVETRACSVAHGVEGGSPGTGLT
jgi:hypothetical protein